MHGSHLTVDDALVSGKTACAGQLHKTMWGAGMMPQLQFGSFEPGQPLQDTISSLELAPPTMATGRFTIQDMKAAFTPGESLW